MTKTYLRLFRPLLIFLALMPVAVGDDDARTPFYTEALGMLLQYERVGGNESEMIYTLGFEQGAKLKLRYRAAEQFEEATYRPGDDDVYWKIGITVPDVDVARARLVDRGIEVTEPVQFHDIGYLCHLDDLDGYCIELLQHRFAGNHVPVQPRDEFALGGQPTLGQISLNVSDVEASLAFYCDRFGMRLLSRQVVPGRGFTLYFLADTDEEPPVSDIDAVENREWLWQRPYTTLELRAFDGDRSLRPHPPEEELGFRGIDLLGVGNCTQLDPDGAHLFPG